MASIQQHRDRNGNLVTVIHSDNGTMSIMSKGDLTISSDLMSSGSSESLLRMADIVRDEQETKRVGTSAWQTLRRWLRANPSGTSNRDESS